MKKQVPFLQRTISQPMDVLGTTGTTGSHARTTLEHMDLTSGGTSFGISPPEQSSLMSVSPMSIQINDSSLVTRLETTHSEPEPEITGLLDFRSSPMSITPESHSPPVKRLLQNHHGGHGVDLNQSGDDSFYSCTNTTITKPLLGPTNSTSSNTLKLPPFAQFVTNRNP